MKPIIQIKVTLDEIKPLIWRRLLVKSSITFYELHNIIQIAFGWENCHLFQFNMEDYFIGQPDPEFEMKIIDSKDVIVGEVMTQIGYELGYEYDFGDAWMHTITIEKFLHLQPDFYYPVCTAGKRAAPLEDCGGIPGYQHVLKALKNKQNPKYREYVEWLSGKRKTYDPECFNLENVNSQLAQLKTYIRKIEKE
jgi:hypothetical protein